VGIDNARAQNHLNYNASITPPTTPARPIAKVATVPLASAKAIAPLFLEVEEEPEEEGVAAAVPAPPVPGAVLDGCEGTVVPVKASAAQEDAAALAAEALVGEPETTVAFPLKEHEVATRFSSW